MRPPAWTDRILFKGNDVNRLLCRMIYHQIEILDYSRAEILISDHRPGRFLLVSFNQSAVIVSSTG